MRRALSIVPDLQEKGATIRAYDPEGMTGSRNILDVDFCNDCL